MLSAIILVVVVIAIIEIVKRICQKHL